MEKKRVRAYSQEYIKKMESFIYDNLELVVKCKEIYEANEHIVSFDPNNNPIYHSSLVLLSNIYRKTFDLNSKPATMQTLIRCLYYYSDDFDKPIFEKISSEKLPSDDPLSDKLPEDIAEESDDDVLFHTDIVGMKHMQEDPDILWLDPKKGEKKVSSSRPLVRIHIIKTKKIIFISNGLLKEHNVKYVNPLRLIFYIRKKCLYMIVEPTRAEKVILAEWKTPNQSIHYPNSSLVDEIAEILKLDQRCKYYDFEPIVMGGVYGKTFSLKMIDKSCE